MRGRQQLRNGGAPNAFAKVGVGRALRKVRIHKQPRSTPSGSSSPSAALHHNFLSPCALSIIPPKRTPPRESHGQARLEHPHCTRATATRRKRGIFDLICQPGRWPPCLWLGGMLTVAMNLKSTSRVPCTREQTKCTGDEASRCVSTGGSGGNVQTPP